MLYSGLVRPLVFGLTRRDPEIAHEFGLECIQFLGRHEYIKGAIATVATPRQYESLSQNFFGRQFAHPVGLAAGFDKNCIALPGLAALGFSFIEGGTVTLWPQRGNPRPRIWRYPRERALRNAMGFPNDGAGIMALSLAKYNTLPVLLCLSLGKSKNTPLGQAVKEYVVLLEQLYMYADFFSINVSSPNTPGLRELQDKRYLDEIIGALVETSRELAARFANKTPKPILIKISPDLSLDVIDDVLELSERQGIQGIIAVNTTQDHSMLNDATAGGIGGVSGRPLLARSLNVVSHIRRHVNDDFVIIGVGGIMNAGDAYMMLSVGADLIQVYTGFVYHGPLFVRSVVREIALRMRRDGIHNLAELRRRRK